MGRLRSSKRNTVGQAGRAESGGEVFDWQTIPQGIWQRDGIWKHEEEHEERSLVSNGNTEDQARQSQELVRDVHKEKNKEINECWNAEHGTRDRRDTLALKKD